MARMPLLSALRAIARVHVVAASLRIPPAAVLARRLDVRATGGMPAPAAPVRPPPSRTRTRPSTRPAARADGARVAIVGAGIAGLSAALTLADAGIACIVFEASRRVGGRMHTNGAGFPGPHELWADGQTAEWCGELIDSGHATIRGLAQRFGLLTIDLLSAEPSGSEEIYYLNGQYYRAAEANRDFEPVYAALHTDAVAAGYPTTFARSTPAGRRLDAMSVLEWIERRVPGGRASPLGKLLDVAYAAECGAETSDLSALAIVYLLYSEGSVDLAVFGDSDERYRIAGGSAALPMAIADALPDGTIRLGWRLTAITARVDGTVDLAFASDESDRPQTLEFDRVILALPFAVLRTLDCTQAGFDPLKRRVIEELGRGRNAKLQLQFTGRPWIGSGQWPGIASGSSFADTGYQASWEATRGQPGESGILVGYLGGDASDAIGAGSPYEVSSHQVVRDAAECCLRQIEPVFPGVSAAWNGRAALSLPVLDPNLKISYSYPRVGQYSTLIGYERVRQGNILFAGEHCSRDFQGFMEGAAATGARAAHDLIQEHRGP
jgi:Monoamine oxidase